MVLHNGADGFDMSNFLSNTAQRQRSEYHIMDEESEARQVTDTIIR